MNNQLGNLQTKSKYDLEERTAKFTESIIDCKLKIIINRSVDILIYINIY